MKEINKEVIAQTEKTCDESGRKRAHYNIHPTLEDPVQRLLIKAEKGTYIRPHRHTEKGKWELFIILDGSASALLFDEDGTVISRSELNNNETRIVEIPPDVWHTLVVKEKSTLVEIKPGPYKPLSDKDFAGWAPSEGEVSAKEFEEKLRNASVGENIV